MEKEYRQSPRTELGSNSKKVLIEKPYNKTAGGLINPEYISGKESCEHGNNSHVGISIAETKQNVSVPKHRNILPNKNQILTDGKVENTRVTGANIDRSSLNSPVQDKSPAVLQKRPKSALVLHQKSNSDIEKRNEPVKIESPGCNTLYQQVTKQQFVVTRKSNYTLYTSPDQKGKLSRNSLQPNTNSNNPNGSFSRSESSLTEAIVDSSAVKNLAESSERLSCEKSESEVTFIKHGQIIHLREKSEQKKLEKQSSASEVETFVTKLHSAYTFDSEDQITQNQIASSLLESLSDTLHRQLETQRQLLSKVTSADRFKTHCPCIKEPETARHVTHNKASPRPEDLSYEQPSHNSTCATHDLSGSGTETDVSSCLDFDGICCEQKRKQMAKLRSSFYKLAWPTVVSSESERKLWKTIFSTLNDSKHNFDHQIPTSPTELDLSFDPPSHFDKDDDITNDLDSLQVSGLNERKRSRSECQQNCNNNQHNNNNNKVYCANQFPSRSRHESKSVSTVSSSLLEEEANSFPPADDVISEDEDEVIVDDPIDSALNDGGSKKEVAHEDDQRKGGHNNFTEESRAVLALSDVSALLVFDRNEEPVSSFDYHSQKSRSVDNLDGPRPTNLLEQTTPSKPSRMSTKRSMNDLLDSKRVLSSSSPYESSAVPPVHCSVRGGTVDALIAYATQDGVNDWRFYEAFLTTYRTFVSVDELLNRLLFRYAMLHPQHSGPIRGGGAFGEREREKRMRISKNCFFLFVRISWELKRDTELDQVLPLISKFCSLLQSVAESKDAALLSGLMKTRSSEMTNNSPSPSEQQDLNSSSSSWNTTASQIPVPRSPLIPQSPNPNRARHLVDLKTRAIAEQLTLMCSQLFQKVELSEVLACAKQYREEQMPNVVAFTRHWNQLSGWVGTQVLRETSDRQLRERTHLKLIKVAKRLSEMNNFSSCFAVLCGLNTHPVARLDWPKTSLEMLSNMSELLSPFHHFGNYREALATAQGACIPHLAIVLHDLQQIAVMPDHLEIESQLESGLGRGSNPGGRSRKVINFSKRWHQYLCLVKLRDSGSMHYHLKENRDVANCLSGLELCLEESELHKLSCYIKPKRT